MSSTASRSAGRTWNSRAAAGSTRTIPSFGANRRVLAQPQGRFHMAGDQLTYWTGWQEGALVERARGRQAIDRQDARCGPGAASRLLNKSFFEAVGG